MKILYLGNFRDSSYEGMMTIVKNIKNYFSKKHSVIVNDISKIKWCDVAHVHSSGFFESMKYYSLPMPIIYSLHSNLINTPFRILFEDVQQNFRLTLSHQFLSRLKRLSFRFVASCLPLFIKKYFLNKMEMVILPSNLMQKKLRLSNTRVIRQGIDVKKFKHVNTPKNKKIKVRHFGASTFAKGFSEVVQAYAHLDSSLDKELFPTHSSPKVNAFVRGVDKTIKVHGFTSHIVKEINKADIIVLPYRHPFAAIATPLTLLEAMACEKAVITTNLPHIKEIGGDSVVYVDPYSPKQIAQAIKKLAEDPVKRKKLGKKARQRIVSYYNQDDMFSAYEKAYKSISSQLR